MQRGVPIRLILLIQQSVFSSSVKETPNNVSIIFITLVFNRSSIVLTLSDADLVQEQVKQLSESVLSHVNAYCLYHELYPLQVPIYPTVNIIIQSYLTSKALFSTLQRVKVRFCLNFDSFSTVMNLAILTSGSSSLSVSSCFPSSYCFLNLAGRVLTMKPAICSSSMPVIENSLKSSGLSSCSLTVSSLYAEMKV